MRNYLTLTLAAVTLIATSACSEQVAAPDASMPAPSAAQGLTVTSETDIAITGHYVHGGSVVTFHSELVAPYVRTHLVVNGAEYDVEKDIVASTMKIDGHGNTILAEDAAALAAIDKAFDKMGEPTRIREEAYKVLSLLSAAPKGTTITTKHIVPSMASKDEQNRGYCDNDDGITYICAANQGAGCPASYTGASGSNPLYKATNGVTGVGGGTNYYGGYVNGCSSTPSYTHEHEVCEYSSSSDHESGQGSYHGRVTWGARIGWSASACEGRCGAGCPNSYNFYVTKDCLDHDVCLNNHPSASSTSTFGDCGNEFDRASGDFTYGTSSGFTGACGFAMWGDSSR
jgi:hypothetical protein